MLAAIKRFWQYMFGKEEDQIVASVGGSNEPMPEATDVCAVAKREGALKRWPKCGHEAHERFSHDWYGQVLTPGKEMLKSHGLCADCLLEKVKSVSCRCALCGTAIFPGHGVALYCDSGDFRKEWKTKVGESVVGCLNMDCCPSGGFFAGHWTPEGFRPAFDGGGTMVSEVFATGKAIIADSDGKVTVLDDKNDKC